MKSGDPGVAILWGTVSQIRMDIVCAAAQGPGAEGGQRSLADIIMDKIRQQQAASGGAAPSQCDPARSRRPGHVAIATELFE